MPCLGGCFPFLLLTSEAWCLNMPDRDSTSSLLTSFMWMRHAKSVLPGDTLGCTGSWGTFQEIMLQTQSRHSCVQDRCSACAKVQEFHVFEGG